MTEITAEIALIGALGMAAQWLAWRLRLPSIALLLAVGFVAGPATGLIDPVRDFGDVYRPLVSIAVAIILFEGGLSLNLHEIRETSVAVKRIVLLGGPLMGVLTALAAHLLGGLSWPTAAILGAVLIVTGPTVVIPLLRQAKLDARPRSVLRWEAIVNDAVGAMAAVIAFEVFLVIQGAHQMDWLLARAAAALVLSLGGGYLLAQAIVWAFVRGQIPEFLKGPVLLAAVLSLFAVTNLALEEAGLLAVTVMGIVLGNSRIASLAELRRFKEMMTVLLVSGLFIVLTAALDMEVLMALDVGVALFVAGVLLVIRPFAVGLVTLRSGLSWRERLLIGWIAPRGIVAVAVAGLFGTALADAGVEDAPEMIAFAFALVVASILLHGFSLGPLARLLGLESVARPGVLIVGGSRWSAALAQALEKASVPVLITDTNWNHLREARLADVPVYFGEVLSEQAHLRIDLESYATVIAATDNDAYNALVCTDLGPELGRSNVYQIGSPQSQSERQSLSFTIGGRPLTDPELGCRELAEAMDRGASFQTTRLTEEFGYEDLLARRPEDTLTVLWVRSTGALVFASTAPEGVDPETGDTVISFGRSA